MLNSRPTIRHIQIGSSETCVVVDDFFSDPDAITAHAVSQRAQFVTAPNGYYPGPELALSENITFELEQFFNQHVRSALGARRTLAATSRLSIVTSSIDQLKPLQRVCHRDANNLGATEGAGAMVAYLFKDTRLGGTSFYMPRRPMEEISAMLRLAGEMDSRSFTKMLGQDPAYPTSSNTWFEHVLHVPAAWNRAVFYNGTVFHSGHITAPELLDADPACGRLTMNAFIRVRKRAV
ncbi:MAG: DUF6445 family protein [Pseudomonadota bacterium]